MRDRVGEEFEGSVSAVTSFGIFVALDDVYVEGLVHISELGQDYFHFDATKHRLLGDRTRKQFRLADRVKVKIGRVDLETSRIDFVLAGDSAADSTTGPRHVRSLRRRTRSQMKPTRAGFAFHALLARLRAESASMTAIYLA